MTRLNADGIDESQWLPKVFNKHTGLLERIPPVNPFRQQHGIVKWEGESIKAISWMPDLLFAKLDADGNQLLNGDHLMTCKAFYSAVVSTRKALGISDLRGYLSDPGQGNPATGDVFFTVMTKLLPYQANMCLWVVCDEYNRGNVALAEKLITSIQNSLDLARKVIDNIPQIDDNAIVPAPEVRLKSSPV